MLSGCLTVPTKHNIKHIAHAIHVLDATHPTAYPQEQWTYNKNIITYISGKNRKVHTMYQVLLRRPFPSGMSQPGGSP